MKILSNVVGYVDRRGPRELAAAAALDQERADQALEAEWRRRVSEHPIEQSRILNGGFWREPTLPGMLRRQAD